jgi:glycosyltransferase involved in cell wall biosynthesis
VHGADRSEVTNGIISLGYVSDDDLHALYSGAMAFCFPSLGEGFGRPPLEAMACGAPVLAAEYGAAWEVLGHAAEILPLEPRRWVDALRRIHHGQEREDRASAAAHLARYDWDSSARAVAECCWQAAEVPVGGGRYA